MALATDYDAWEFRRVIISSKKIKKIVTWGEPAYFRAFCLLLAATLIFFYLPLLDGSRNFYFRDVTLYFEPLLNFIGNSFRHGRLPLWNPFCYCGMSEIAIPSPAVFYPGNLLFAVCPFSKALALNMLLSQLLAGIGAFLAISTLGWGAGAAAGCGFILALSGYMFSLESNYTLVANSAWLIMMIAALRKLEGSTERQRFFWCLLLSFSTFAFLTAGRPEITGPGLVILFIYLLVRCLQEVKAKKRATTAWQFLSWPLRCLFIGTLLSMPSLLPSLEWIPLSRRSSGLDNPEILLFSANWYDLLCLVAQQPLGDLQLRWAKFLPVVSNAHMVPFISSAYIGPAAMTLVFIGSTDRTWSFRLPSFVFLLGGLLFCLGDTTPVTPWLLSVFPPLALIRFPIKLLIFVVMTLSIFAARGLYRLMRQDDGPTLWFPLVFWTVCLQASAAALCFPGLLEKLTPANAPSQLIAEAQILIAQSGVVASLIGLGTVALLFLARRKILGIEPALCMILAIHIVSVMTCALSFQRHTASANFFSSDSLLANAIENIDRNASKAESGKEADSQMSGLSPVSKPRVAGLYLENFTCPLSLQPEDPSLGTAAWCQYQRQMLCPNTNMDFALPSPWGYESSMTADYFNSFVTAYTSSAQSGSPDQDRPLWPKQSVQDPGLPKSDQPLARFLELSATKYATTQVYKFSRSGAPPLKVPPLDSLFFKLALEDPQLNLRVYKVLHSLPRAYTTCCWRWVEKHERVLHSLFSEAPTDVDSSVTTILEGNDAGACGAATPFHSAKSEAAGKKISLSNAQEQSNLAPIKFLRDQPEDIVLEVSAANENCLVLADHYYPGWQASIDGQPTITHLANGFFRAVILPAGRHRVEFQFRPSSFSTGLLLAVLGLSWLALLGTMSLRSKDEQELQDER